MARRSRTSNTAQGTDLRLGDNMAFAFLAGDGRARTPQQIADAAAARRTADARLTESEARVRGMTDRQLVEHYASNLTDQVAGNEYIRRGRPLQGVFRRLTDRRPAAPASASGTGNS